MLSYGDYTVYKSRVILLKVGHNSREFSSLSANVPAPEVVLVVLADGYAHKMEVTQHLKETVLHYFHVQS